MSSNDINSIVTQSKQVKTARKLKVREKNQRYYLKNREKFREKGKQWRIKNPEKVKAHNKELEKTRNCIKLKYYGIKSNAKRRGIPFKLTYEEWLKVWGSNINNVGRRRGQYVMARFRDEGAYEIGNVYITTCSENIAYSSQNYFLRYKSMG
jgi:hypothetical protein